MKGVCVVTGGSRGIGAACAELAAEKGYDVCLSYISNESAAGHVASLIEKKGRKAKFVRCDVADEGDVINLFKAADDMGPLALLINNAGKVDQTDRVENYTADRLARMFSVNVIGSIVCAREAVRRMSTKRGGNGGAIVNVSSAAAYLASPGQYVDYASSKGAVDVFTKGLALEVADEGIRVNGVRPGLIDTELHASGGEPDRIERLKEMVPVKREGTAAEVAEAILWLASDCASYVTGATLNVTGGR